MNHVHLHTHTHKPVWLVNKTGFHLLWKQTQSVLSVKCSAQTVWCIEWVFELEPSQLHLPLLPMSCPVTPPSSLWQMRELWDQWISKMLYWERRRYKYQNCNSSFCVLPDNHSRCNIVAIWEMKVTIHRRIVNLKQYKNTFKNIASFLPEVEMRALS